MNWVSTEMLAQVSCQSNMSDWNVSTSKLSE